MPALCPATFSNSYTHYWVPHLHELCLMMLLPLVPCHLLCYSWCFHNPAPLRRVTQSSAIWTHQDYGTYPEVISPKARIPERLSHFHSLEEGKMVPFYSEMLSLLMPPHLLPFVSTLRFPPVLWLADHGSLISPRVGSADSTPFLLLVVLNIHILTYPC